METIPVRYLYIDPVRLIDLTDTDKLVLWEDLVQWRKRFCYKLSKYGVQYRADRSLN